ncbi:MAG: hybrid sensor histidine kinase/response regulator [Methanomicrobiales archaeon HGW-Methanomicrobiales-4]|nr:MAG: hybrid sensor histidine kinase/response regulator [Methanomicrobiales archaeon HGW-Methanomicrobiales-4]
MNDPYTQSPVSILIVEDSRTQATILKHLLESAGYCVFLRYNGQEALELLDQETPTLVLTDIVMPKMNGYELCQAIKQNPKTRDVPVILVTQLYDPQDVIEGLECGADNFIIKPYDNQYLLSRIKVILANRVLQKNEVMNVGVEVFFAGKRHFITSNRLQILNILLSTYEMAIQKNNELLEAKDRLATLNDQMSEANEFLLKANENLNREIEERRRIEFALSQANKKLSLLSSITRHDMKNILMAVLGYHELADIDTRDPAFHEYLAREKILFSKLTNQIEFTRLYDELGNYEPIWKPLKVMRNIRFSDTVNIPVIISPDAEQYEIFTDPLIEKVFYNLFENSVRHGGKVTTITVTVENNSAGLRVLVSDNGSGISDADKVQIFKRGFGKNTGLGLFLVREILSITGITIDEIGHEGDGACFEMIVPPGNFRLFTE